MAQAAEHVFLAEVKAGANPGPYAEANVAAKKGGREYWGIWNFLVLHPMAAHHLCEHSHVLRFQPAPVAAILRELSAAYTSSLNRCDFCMEARATVAAQLFGDRQLVRSVLRACMAQAGEQPPGNDGAGHA